MPFVAVQPRWGDPDKADCSLFKKYIKRVYLEGWYFAGFLPLQEIKNIPKKYKIKVSKGNESRTCQNCNNTVDYAINYIDGYHCKECGVQVEMYEPFSTTWKIE